MYDGCMKHSPSTAQQWPRLVIEKSEVLLGAEKGYLQLNPTAEKLEIGLTNDTEFQLMQCLFSPRNFPTARYEPVTQTYERLYSNIRKDEKKIDEFSNQVNDTAEEKRIADVVERLLKSLARSVAGSHFTFTVGGGKALMTFESIK